MDLIEAKQILNDNGYVLEDLVEAKRKQKPQPFIGIRRRPGGKCKPAFYTYEEAEAYLDKFTYPQDFEIVNLRVHPEFLEEDFTQGVGAPLGADQGIPSSMQCCAVPMMRLGEPAPYGKIQKPYPGHRPPPPHKRHKPIGVYLLGSNVNLLTYGRKKKKKKSIKRR